MSFYGVTTAHTKSFLLVKKSCKEILLFFDKQNLPGVIWSSNLHCLFTPCKTESCYIQPNTFEVPTLECYSRQGLREQGSNSPCPISNIPPFCPGHTFPEVSWEQLWSGPAPHTSAPTGGRREHCQGRSWCGTFSKCHHIRLRCQWA